MQNAFQSRILVLPIALALLLVACGGNAGDDDSAAENGAATGAAAVAVPVGDGAESEGREPAGGVPAGNDAQIADAGRKIIRTATISLVIDDLDEALREVRAAALTTGGFVAESNIVVTNAEDEQVARPETALITIRVPAEQFDDVMERLRTGARGVDAEETGVNEVTAEYTDLESRLRNLEATETQYVTLLDRAQTIDEIITVQDKVNAVRGEIESVQGRLNLLDNQTDLATITVSLRLADIAVVAATSDPQWAVQAWQTSLEASAAMIVVLGTLAIAGAFVAVWVIPPTIVALIVWRKFGPLIAAVARKMS